MNQPRITKPTEPDDQMLVRRFKQGEREYAFKTLVQRYQERVYWTIRRIVGDHDDTDDIAQETFVTVWKKLDTFREEANFFTWLYRIAINAALGHLRRQKVRKLISLETLTRPFIDPEQSSEKQVLALERTSAIEHAIQKLPPQQRLVFCMRYYDGLKYDEIALILNKSMGTLKANYHHAVKKLEDALRDEFATA
jgi:RNA polymerase sigma-70 factor (ECF subfamily)